LVFQKLKADGTPYWFGEFVVLKLEEPPKFTWYQARIMKGLTCQQVACYMEQSLNYMGKMSKPLLLELKIFGHFH